MLNRANDSNGNIHAAFQRIVAAAAFPVSVGTLTALVAFVGALIGFDHLNPAPGGLARHRVFVDHLAIWDGSAYQQIAAEGYSYERDKGSIIAFFPFFPWLAASLKFCFNLPSLWGLLFVAHVSLLASFIVFSVYARFGEPHANYHGDFAVLSFGLFPITVFFRLAYSESLFLFLILLAMLGIQRGWRSAWIALFIGLATGTRFVGIALLPPFLWYLWNCSPSRTRFLMSAVPLSALSLSGLLAFMLYQKIEFGDALAFAKTQADFAKHRTEFSLAEIGNLLIGKPLWATYVPGNPVSWLAHDNVYINPVFSLNFANPIYWLFAWALIGIGVYKRWLTKYEVLLSAGLLLIPYLTVASMNGMRSQGRYAAVVFPCYIVMGKLLSGLDPATRTIVFCAMAIGLFLYSAMFVAGYAIF